MIYAVFLRGINISGKNKIPMKELKAILSKNGYPDAETLLNSGNIVLSSHKKGNRIITSHCHDYKRKFRFGYTSMRCFRRKTAKGYVLRPRMVAHRQQGNLRQFDFNYSALYRGRNRPTTWSGK